MMAAASNGSPTRHLTVPTGDRLKAIEAKVVILGAQGQSAMKCRVKRSH